jgi:hypothetical protein
MPYIITTVPRGCRAEDMENRYAVATLFEACEEAAHRIEVITGGDEDYEEIYTDAQNCSELGETFGPLANGTVVKVEPVSWDHLTRDMPEYVSDENINAFSDQILAAYNDH